MPANHTVKTRSPTWRSRASRLLNRAAKHAIVASPIGLPRLIGQLHQLFELRRFVRDSGLDQLPYFPAREGLYEFLNATLLPQQPIDYLEFGVFEGASIKHWVALNQHPSSRFFGFDTFEGLPEPWTFATGTLEAGHFSTAGAFPDIPDQRVQFVKGLFQDTLGAFIRAFEPNGRMVVHCDADLYTSTLYVLASMHEFLAPGAVVIFDEFGSVNHEFRAFMDYAASFRQKFSPLAHAGRFYEQVAFVIDR